MNAVDPPQGLADATNSNAARALTLAAAGFGVVPKLVLADAARLNTLCSAEDADLRAFFQGAFSGCRVRSQSESGMSESAADRIYRVSLEAAEGWRQLAVDRTHDFCCRCESEIERVLGATMVLFFRELAAGCGHKLPFRFSYSDYSWPDRGCVHDDCGVTGYSQAMVGPYRVDFLLRAVRGSEVRFVVVECDGHDFHERTKEQAERDRSRDRWMATRGLVVLRFTGSEIWREPCQCALEIYNALGGVPSNGGEP